MNNPTGTTTGSADTAGKLDTKCILICMLMGLVIFSVMVCLVVAYSNDLGGEVKIENKDHNPCELKVDEKSARNITNLILIEDVKLFFLDLKFPAAVQVNNTNNIFQKESMVWTIGGYPVTKHFLDLPWMYFVWSLGLLDRYTYRHVDLIFKIKGSDTCSLFLGTNKTTVAIGNALKDLMIKITKENNRDVMNSIWCQTYLMESITYTKFLQLFQFYYSNVRYMCSHLDQSDFEVVSDAKFRPFPRQWSDLAFTLTIVVLLIFPFLFLYLENEFYDPKYIYLGLSSPIVAVFLSHFQNCSSLCLYVGRLICLCIFIFCLCPLSMYITYIIIATVPEAKTSLSNLSKTGNVHPWNIFSSELGTSVILLLIYLIASVILVIFSFVISYCKQPWRLFPYFHSEKSTDHKILRILVHVIPWLYVCFKHGSAIYQNINDCSKKLEKLIIVCFYIFINIWLFCFILILFYSLMFFFMFFSFGILSIITYPKFTTGIFTYIFAGILFVIKSIRYPGKQYHQFLGLIIDVMEKDEKMKAKCRINRQGDFGISQILFIKLVHEHQLLIRIICKVFLELFFFVTLLVWTTCWIHELNQWKEMSVFRDIFIAGIIYNIPNILQILNFVHNDDDIMKRRLRKSISKFYAEMSLDGIKKAHCGIKRTHAWVNQAFTAVDQGQMEQVRSGIEEGNAGIQQARKAIQQDPDESEHGGEGNAGGVQPRTSNEEVPNDVENGLVTKEDVGNRINQCFTEIEQTHREILQGIDRAEESGDGNEQVVNGKVKILVGLKEICNGLSKALCILKCQCTEQVNDDDKENAIMGLNKASGGLEQVINGID